MNLRPLFICLIVLAQGCATCREHPKACAVTVVVLATAVIYGASTISTQRPNHCANINLEC